MVTKSFKNYLPPLIAGIIYSFSIPSFLKFSFIGAAFLSHYVFLFFLDPNNQRRKFSIKNKMMTMLLFSLGTTLSGFYWIPYTLKEFGEIPFPYSQIVGTLFFLIVFPQYWTFVFICYCTNKFSFLKKWTLRNSTKNILWASTLTLLEIYIPQQFPAHVGHTFLNMAPFLGLAPIFGTPIFSFAVFWTCLTFIYPPKNTFPKILFSAMITVFFLSNIIFKLKGNIDSKKSINIRIVQANVGNYLKVRSERGHRDSVSGIL
ncbi:hypothetical protein OAB57_01640, partial [Bacteriovoracaceae bacterium]|nr:hypothetical protein [Bacteriovoracaceae bacterium]